ncbi:MAG: type II toxin-antitoxin system VapC family toxin [Chloroflexota bacterium]|nr:type II toxin-antitoxin system VapC family toxin [Chloroflexota bacterium]
MILMDTHIWVWFVDESNQLSERHRQVIEHHRADGLGLSVISCWEVAKLVEYNRLKLACSIEEWIESATTIPGVRLIGLTPNIAITSTKLPGDFHRDPADQIIVATAQTYDIELLTADKRILKYEHVRTV